jgi:phosphatidylinositol alpha-1,6-mannosyltransferase
MKVLALTDSLADTDGVGRYCIRLMTAMQSLRSDVEVEVALARKHPPHSASVPKAWPVTVCLPPDYYYYVSRPRFLAYTAWALARLLPLARRADVIHAIKDYPHCWLAWLAARATGKPCIMTAHGTYAVVPLSDPRHAARVRKCYPQFHRILCVSNYTKQQIERHMTLDNLEVMPNAVDASHYAPRPRLAGRPWTGKRYLLGIGSLKERKGHHLALAAFARFAREFPELEYYILGAFTEGDPYFETIRAGLRSAGCGDRVLFLGHRSEEEKIDLLQGAELFVHTPVTAADGGFEGFGIVYLEAAASGVPSIGTVGNGAEDAVVEGKTGFLVGADAELVAESCRRVLRDPSLRAALARECVAHARAQSWKLNAKRVLELYEGAVNA